MSELTEISDRLADLLKKFDSLKDGQTSIQKDNKDIKDRLLAVEQGLAEREHDDDTGQGSRQDGGRRGEEPHQQDIDSDLGFDRFLPADINFRAHGATGGNSDSSAAVELGQYFDRVRDSLQRVQLPADCKLFDSQVGIKQECKATLKVISKCGRFAETGLKLYGQWISSGTRDTQGGGMCLSEDDLQRMFYVLLGQVYFLRSEYASLVVASNFDQNTTRYFRQFENNQGAFGERSLNNIRVAAELSNLTNRNVNTSGRGRWNGGRGSGPRRGNQGNSRFGNEDVYSNFYTRRNTFGPRRGGGASAQQSQSFQSSGQSDSG